MQRRFDAIGFIGSNSFLKEEIQIAFMKGVPDGGFGEDRTTVLDTLFHPDHPRPLIHLGTDIKLAAFTPVKSVAAGTVVEVYTDLSDFCGWGTRVTVAAGPYMYVHAHLGTARVNVGETVTVQSVLGHIGTYSTNGGWFPHLHVQKCDQTWYRTFTSETLPAYATSTSGNKDYLIYFFFSIYDLWSMYNPSL